MRFGSARNRARKSFQQDWRLTVELRHGAQLRYLLPRIVENDRQIAFINARAMPTGVERLLSAELIARGLEGWRVKSSDVVRITRELCLPAFKHDPHASYAWQDR